MSAEEFQLIDETVFDNSILKRDFSKIYHEHGVYLIDYGESINLFFGVSSKFYPIGNSYLQFELTLEKDGGQFEDDNTDMIRLVKIASAHLSTEKTTTGGSEVEVNM